MRRSWLYIVGSMRTGGWFSSSDNLEYAGGGRSRGGACVGNGRERVGSVEGGAPFPPTQPAPVRNPGKGERPEVGRHAGAPPGVGLGEEEGEGAENATGRHWTPQWLGRLLFWVLSRRMHAAVCGPRYQGPILAVLPPCFPGLGRRDSSWFSSSAAGVDPSSARAGSVGANAIVGERTPGAPPMACHSMLDLGTADDALIALVPTCADSGLISGQGHGRRPPTEGWERPRRRLREVGLGCDTRGLSNCLEGQGTE